MQPLILKNRGRFLLFTVAGGMVEIEKQLPFSNIILVKELAKLKFVGVTHARLAIS